MSEVITVPLKEKIEELEKLWLKTGTGSYKLQHTFATGVYMREVSVPANTYALGHEHTKKGINILLKGACSLLVSDGETIHLKAPTVLVADAGSRKLIFYSEDSIWANVLPNPDNIEDLDKLEELFVVKSQAFIEHQLSSEPELALT